MATFSGTLGWVRKAFPSISLSEVRSWRVKMIRIRITEGQVIHMKVQWWAVWPLCRNFRLGSWPGLSEGSVALLYNCNQGYLPSLWHWWSSTQYDLGQWFSKICWAFNYLPLTSDPKFIWVNFHWGHFCCERWLHWWSKGSTSLPEWAKSIYLFTCFGSTEEDHPKNSTWATAPILSLNDNFQFHIFWAPG